MMIAIGLTKLSDIKANLWYYFVYDRAAELITGACKYVYLTLYNSIDVDQNDTDQNETIASNFVAQLVLTWLLFSRHLKQRILALHGTLSIFIIGYFAVASLPFNKTV